ncbi:MAG: RNA methyltransferase [Pseudobdellovibrionaceae bacterium]|nr:RNA methyltransferase [Bdellovibrionales bacterium]USN47571.1 MAG: RNA methyltransferase [Pseudobdellovibrionaceae bacterium]
MSLLEDSFSGSEGQIYSSDQVIEALSPQITARRLARMKEVVAERTYSFASVLENIYDRGNVSAVMRSAEAFGFMNFHIVEQPDARFKAANRVTQGTDKWLDIKKHASTSACVSQLRGYGYKIYATHLEASVPIDEVDFSQPTAVVFGNEKDGVSDEMLSACDGRIILPMHGFAQSFNISVAAAITFYHVYQARTAALGKSGDLSEQDQQILFARYIQKSVPRSALR